MTTSAYIYGGAICVCVCVRMWVCVTCVRVWVLRMCVLVPTKLLPVHDHTRNRFAMNTSTTMTTTMTYFPITMSMCLPSSMAVSMYHKVSKVLSDGGFDVCFCDVGLLLENLPKDMRPGKLAQCLALVMWYL